jgi:hypothetical protein
MQLVRFLDSECDARSVGSDAVVAGRDVVEKMVSTFDDEGTLSGINRMSSTSTNNRIKDNKQRWPLRPSREAIDCFPLDENEAIQEVDLSQGRKAREHGARGTGSLAQISKVVLVTWLGLSRRQ